ncbi:MAG TPA: polyprenyl diphosphate synthase [Bryobacteraceae bacterium]|nr:polyprenyl diphosphate synthase [Bryobacteraceae bacterium]
MKSTFHLAVIMDGNGRWAQRRGLPRLAGHHAGERALRRVVKAAAESGISTLTAYAFSSDNWNRPREEVQGLMFLLQTHLARSVELSKEHGVRISIIGRRDRISGDVRSAIEQAEAETEPQSRLHLRLAIDYSSRDVLLAALRNAGSDLNRQSVSQCLGASDVDLLIRTGGEQRLSDFLLWECAYAELLFTPCLWPDFGEDELKGALREFARRDRRFGGLPNSAYPAAGSQLSVVESRG